MKPFSTLLVSTAALFSASACAAEPHAFEAVSRSYLLITGLTPIAAAWVI